ncbi:MAG: glycerol acyltransferase [Bacteroidaceae bacterium]|nr:glycerol acyltransferase [Bacteroidaceae bacterium]
MPQPLLVDVDRIIKNKLGPKAKYVPGFVTSYLKRIIHQDWINQFILQEGEIQGVQWMKDCVEYLRLNITVKGLENLPLASEGRRFTFASNHPLGGPEGIVLGSLLGEHYEGNIRFLANDILMGLSGLAPLFVPINKTGRQARDLPRMVDASFKSDHNLIIFPAGLCSRMIDGRVQDLPWTKTFVAKSVESQRDIVPIHFSGQNSPFFYRLANVTKWLGLKVNIAMLYLVDELYKQQGNHLTIHIGKPIAWQHFTAEKTPTQWAAFVRDLVYQLPSKT